MKKILPFILMFLLLPVVTYASLMVPVTFGESTINEHLADSLKDNKYVKDMYVEIDEELVTITGKILDKFDVALSITTNEKYSEGDGRLEKVLVSIVGLDINGTRVSDNKFIKEMLEKSINNTIYNKLKKYAPLPIYDFKIQDEQIYLRVNGQEVAEKGLNDIYDFY